MVSLKKKQQRNKIVELLKKNKNFLLLKINRITHQSLESLRKELKKDGSKIKVVKNTLFEKAINLLFSNSITKNLKKNFFPLKDTTALICLSNNWVDHLKKINQFITKEKSLEFRLGVIDNNLYSQNELVKLALLPNKEEILSKIISSMKSSVYRLIYSLKYETNKLVFILKEKSESN